MPSRRKTLMFASAFFTSLCSFVIVCVVLATNNWVSSDITNMKENPNMKLVITYGLFQGVCSDISQGIGSPPTSFQVAGALGSDTSKIFHGVIIFLLVVTMLSSFLSSGFTCQNAISNPYQTFLGPTGVYTWNSMSCVCCLLNLILFAVNVEVNKLSAELASKYCTVSSDLEQSNISYGYSYWIMLLIIALNATTVIILVFYQRAKYSKKKERERPLDSAPKDGILF